jgi:hypothetical protein
MRKFSTNLNVNKVKYCDFLHGYQTSLVICVLMHKSQFIVPVAVEDLQPEAGIFQAMIHVF